MDDPGWRRGLQIMALVTAAAGVVYMVLAGGHRGDMAFVIPFAVLVGFGILLRSHAHAVAWPEYGRGLRDGFWGGIAVLALFLGGLFLLALPYR